MLKVFRTFYSFMLKRKLLFVSFLFSVIFSNILSALNPYFFKKIVDNIPTLNFDNLLKILLLFIIVRISSIVIDIFAYWLGDMVSFNAGVETRIKIFKKVQDLDFAFHTHKSTGSLISAFKRGDSSLFSFHHDLHHKMLGVLTNFLVMCFFFYRLDLNIVLMVFASFLVTIIASKFLINHNVAKRKIFNNQEDNISGIITDNLINFETVKLFAKERWEENRLRNSFVLWMKSLWAYANTFRVIDATMGTIINTSIFVILYIAISKTINDKLNVGDFVLITGFISSFYPKLWDLVWGFRDLAKNYADIEKYYSLLDNDIEIKDPTNPISIKSVKGDILFRNVSHSYKDGTKNAIKNLTLNIKSGESVAFVGRSGSGKTTITKLLMRFFDPSKGNITIDGIDIKKMNKSDLRKLFGVVPQEAVLFNNTIEYNIGYGSSVKYKPSNIAKAASLANISNFIESLPDKYKTNVGERGIKLSGGQKQRLAIARMIMKFSAFGAMSNPIVIFDEATSHLDSESERLIQDAFWKYAKGKTTIIIAHRLSTIARADRIVVMDKGQIVETGTHIELLNKNGGIYKKLWNIQKQH